MEEIIPIEKIVKVLKGIIDRNGTKYIASKPFQVYEKLLESKDVDESVIVKSVTYSDSLVHKSVTLFGTIS